MSIRKSNSVKSTDTNKSIISVALSEITASGFNPRKTFGENGLGELSDSIRQVGVLQPVLLRRQDNMYEIVCGERRFRASELAGLKTIPAIIRDLSDDEALELSITENLQREDIKPIEEAAGFTVLLETNKYDYAALAKRIGKSEAYVRNRVKLTELIPEIAQMIDCEEINIGIGLCIATYPEDIQHDAYLNHLQGRGYSWWGSHSTKEFHTVMERTYSLLLENYNFDKSQCVNCPHNTNTYSIFPDGSGKCTRRTCLTGKNSGYLLSETVTVANRENIRYVCVEHSNNIDNAIFDVLEKEGLIFPAGLYAVCYPEAPEQPECEDFEDEIDYINALENFHAESEAYETEKADFDNLINTGRIAKCIEIKQNSVTVVYLEIEDHEDQPSQNREEISGTQEIQDVRDIPNMPLPAVEHSIQIKKLKQQDKRNQEIVIEHILEDAKGLIRTVPAYSGDLSDMEIKMMYYFMLPSMARDKERLLIPGKDFAMPEDKMELIENLTVEKMNLIVREYLRVNFNQVYRGSNIAGYFLDFVNQHCPVELAGISKRYNDIYEKRKKRIDDGLAELTAPVSDACLPEQAGIPEEEDFPMSEVA
jgi:ParB family chromosome partitioning protein